MSVQRVLFVIFGAVALGSAIRLVSSRRIFHAALWMMGSFFGIAVLYVLLESPFMAGVQLFIYIGGVAVLTVIAIMVTKGMMKREQRTIHDPWTSLVIALVLFATLSWTILQIPWPQTPMFEVPEDGLERLGMALVDPEGYMLPFQVVSVMFLVVILSSLYLGREH